MTFSKGREPPPCLALHRSHQRGSDRVLLRRAKEAGAQVHRHASVRAVSELEGGALRISYEERGRTRQLVARWVVDCTCRTGLMARAGSGRVAKGPRTIALVGVWERRPHWELADESHTVVESYDGGWAWSVPVSRTRRQVTVMLDPSRTSVARGGRLRLTYREELARTTMIRGITENARFLGSPWARDASSYECESAAQGSVLAAQYTGPEAMASVGTPTNTATETPTGRPAHTNACGRDRYIRSRRTRAARDCRKTVPPRVRW